MPVEAAPWFWLCVISELPPTAELQAFLQGDSEAISQRVAEADQFWLGESNPANDRAPTTPADRIAALLARYYRDTAKDTLPVLTRDMTAAIWIAYAPDGRVEFPCFSLRDLLRFLRAHEGGFVFVRVGGSSAAEPHDEEMNRLMRQHAASVNRGARSAVTVKVLRRLSDEPDDGDGPDDGDEGGVREPRRPRPNPPPVSAAVDPDEDQR
jgi:hypothetical protein